MRSVSIPFEVPRPFLKTWIEELNSADCDRIVSVRLDAFEAIAGAAREPKIRFRLRASAHRWLDVFYLEFPGEQELRAQ